MTPNKRQTSSLTKSLTTPTEKRTQKKRKQDDNQSTHVTMEMYNNLKRTINKMDNEMNKFPKRYSVEQSVITEEITDILENSITPLTEENAQLKLDLEAANKIIENLNSLLLDMTNQNANKVKELKNWVSCKLEAIECNNSQLSERLQIVEKTTKSPKDQSKPNKRNQTLDTVAKDRATQASDNIKNASNNSLDIARPDLNQISVGQQEKPQNEKNIVIIMDSNRKFINFNQLPGGNLKKGKVIVIPCSSITSAEKILESHQIGNPTKILLRTGINDIENTEPENIPKDLVQVAEKFEAKYKCQVYTSDITPR